MRTIIIGDIHGCYKELKALLKKVNFQETKDTLISLGDLMDRGERSYEVFDYFRKLKATMKNRCIIIRGNHEHMMINSPDDPWMMQMWQHDGGLETVKSFHLHDEQVENHINWFRNNTVLYYEAQWFQCVHAGIKNEIPARNDTEFLLWDRSTILFNNYIGKITIVGHTPLEHPFYFAGRPKDTRRIPEGKQMDLPEIGVICLDTGCVSGGRLTAMVIEGYEFYVESVPRIIEID